MHIETGQQDAQFSRAVIVVTSFDDCDEKAESLLDFRTNTLVQTINDNKGPWHGFEDQFKQTLGHVGVVDVGVSVVLHLFVALRHHGGVPKHDLVQQAADHGEGGTLLRVFLAAVEVVGVNALLLLRLAFFDNEGGQDGFA
jgi:hypothetical protein